MKKQLSFICWCMCLALFSAPATAQDERLTTEWIFSEEGKTATSVPKHIWLDSGVIMLYDTRPPKSERTIESFDADNGRRRKVVDAADVIASMTDILEPEEAIEELGWPAAFDKTGRWAVYEKSGDILLVDLRSSDVIPIAISEADEKSARFSPDSQWIAFVRDNDLYVWNVDDRSEKRLTTGASETLLNGTVSWVYWEELLGRVDQGYFWAPDSGAIAYLQTDDSGVGEMHYVDFEPNLPRLINQRHPKPGESNPRVRAGVVSLENAKTTWIDLGSYPYEYLARIKWLPDSQRIALQTLNRPQTALDIFIANTATGTASHLIRETDPAWVNVHDDLYFLADNEHFIWRSERDGYAHLYLYDMEGELVHQVTSGKWALRSSGGLPGMSQSVAHIDEDNGQIFFTSLEKASTERHLYRISLDGSDMQRITTADGSHAILFQPDGAFYLDRTSAIDRPPSLALHHASGEPVTTLSATAAEIPQRFDMLPWEMMTVKARDGFEMPAAMLKPRFFDASKQYPAVVYVYGGPSAPTVVNAWPGGGRGYFHQMLADNDVVVFYVDNRSAAGKSKIDANTIVNQLYGPVELNDLLDGVEWLKAQSFINADNVGVWGWSGGGAMTLQSMTSSNEFAAGVAVAPVSDWHYYDTIYTERYMKRPQDNEEGYESTSHAKRAADLQGRLLLVHGTYDDNVHPQNSWSFSDGLIEAGITFDMMIYPMRKHGISDDAAQAHVYKSMLEFWQRNFKLVD
ncbi:MAG: dipeptidyl-peptidase-4 [Woeseiaceae bacterium]|jgi:dipeptidyl-peptidase-4